MESNALKLMDEFLRDYVEDIGLNKQDVEVKELAKENQPETVR